MNAPYSVEPLSLCSWYLYPLGSLPVLGKILDTNDRNPRQQYYVSINNLETLQGWYGGLRSFYLFALRCLGCHFQDHVMAQCSCWSSSHYIFILLKKKKRQQSGFLSLRSLHMPPLYISRWPDLNGMDTTIFWRN